jgi:2-amino-4-hydroxy-6-hydroxymethyldihydropteridine diphosphokinase
MRTSYIIALGSNRCHRRYRSPEQVIAAAMKELALPIAAVSAIIRTAPIGPSLRRYANAAAIVETDMEPPALLAHLKAIERRFGQRRGQRWSARVLDLDIILWSGGCWNSPSLTIPHPQFRARTFVLDPLCKIAGGSRDPITGLSAYHLKARRGNTSPFGALSSVGRATDF